MQRISISRWSIFLYLTLLSSAASSRKLRGDSKISRIQPTQNVVPWDVSKTSLESHGNERKQSWKTSNDQLTPTNQDVFKSLGLSKLNIPASHYRKRLAVESRHHARPDDSHMYIIKLPPNQVYYSKTNGPHEKNSITNNKKVSVDFTSNGKPGRIYHWNLPVLKKMIEKDGRHWNLRKSNDISELIDIKDIPTWTKPWENDTIDKSYRKNDRHHKDDESSEHRKKTYYAPRPKKSHNNVQNYFPGNGKPKSFYVIKKESHKPYYQKLIP